MKRTKQNSQSRIQYIFVFVSALYRQRPKLELWQGRTYIRKQNMPTQVISWHVFSIKSRKTILEKLENTDFWLPNPYRCLDVVLRATYKPRKRNLHESYEIVRSVYDFVHFHFLQCFVHSTTKTRAKARPDIYQKTKCALIGDILACILNKIKSKNSLKMRKY